MLSDSEIYNDTNKTRLQEALAEQGALKSELESLEEQWLEVSEQLEEAQ
jgi:ATP-binding cassette subfamily F protein 3